MSEADGIGTIATGALIAHEIERARLDAPAAGHSGDEPCANCGLERVGPYCHGCGQTGHVHRNLGALVHDLAHGVFHFEGKIWRTLPLLIRRPGELTRRYVMGERAKFVSPVALFLFSVFLMFAMFGTGGHKAAPHKQTAAARTEIATAEARLKAAQAQRKAARDPAERARLGEKITSQATELAVLNGLSKAGIQVGEPTAAMPMDAERGNFNTGWEWFDEMTTGATKNPDLLFYKLKTYAYKYSWALVPISLPLIWLLFAFRRDVGLYDHAIFAIYSLSFMSLGVVVLVVLGRLGVSSAITSLAAMIVPPIHIYKQLKGAYRLGRIGAGWRTLMLLVFTSIALTIFAALIFYLGAE